MKNILKLLTYKVKDCPACAARREKLSQISKTFKKGFKK